LTRRSSSRGAPTGRGKNPRPPARE
jgi:hypothetical protein